MAMSDDESINVANTVRKTTITIPLATHKRFHVARAERGMKIQDAIIEALEQWVSSGMAEGVRAKVQDLQANPNRQDAPDSDINQAPIQAPNANPNVVATLDAAATETQILRDEIRRLEKRVEDEIARIGEARERDQRPVAPRKKPAKKRVKRGGVGF